MKTRLLIIIGVFFIAISSLGQRVNRHMGDKPISASDTKFDTFLRPSIFKDYGKIYPDLPGCQLNFYGGVASIDFAGQEIFFITDPDAETMLLQTDSELLSSPISISDGTHFASTDDLILGDLHDTREYYPYRNIQNSRNTSCRVTYAPIQYSGNIQNRSTAIQGDYEQIRCGKITTYGRRSTLREPALRYRINIPRYHVFSFEMENGNNIVVYKTTDVTGDTQFTAQNISYIKYIDDKGRASVLLDSDCNGTYTEDEDQIIHNVESVNKYVKVNQFPVDNPSVSSIKEAEFVSSLDIKMDNNKISLLSRNKKFPDKGAGKLILKDLPAKATININGKNFVSRYSAKKLRCQYGRYRLKITAPGHDDFVRTFEVNGTNKEQVISFLNDQF